MSAKWRALQHRHRYTYGSAVFPESFAANTITVNENEFPSFSSFMSELRNLVSLSTSYSQLDAVKNLAASFAELVGDAGVPAELVSRATRLYLEILFLENSLPLHRTIISAIAKSKKILTVIDGCFVGICENNGSRGGKEKKRFLVARAGLSLMSYPKLGFMNDTIDKCAVSIALDVVDGLMGVVSDIDCGLRPSPTVMEQCQEAMSCLYYLLQRFPLRFYANEESMNVYHRVLWVIVSVLKSAAFSRDCLVAAGVSFWAALQVCIGPQDLVYFIAQVFFSFDGEGLVQCLALKYEEKLYDDIVTLSTLSRLCLLRGMLTAIPRPVLNAQLNGIGRKDIWSILYNGILPELCNYCENPIDSHFNFHALTVTQICFQQIKTSLQSDLTDFSGDYDPLPEDITKRIMKIIWNNLEDPLSQTVKQVHLIFDLFLDIQTNIFSAVDREKIQPFLCKIASDLLCLGPRCKGRYVPLAVLSKRLGAKTILNMKPKLLFETTHAYVDDDVCCAATSFLKSFLECFRDECWSSDGVEMGYEIFREVCLPPILQGLISGVSKLRSNLNTYALPVVLEVDVDSIFSMLSFISIGSNGEENDISHVEIAVEQCVAVLVSLLKVSRILALMEGDIDWEHNPSSQHDSNNHVALVSIKGIKVRVIVEWLEVALCHADEGIRIDAAETLFLNPKTASLPSSLELCLMRKAVPLNMRCCSTAFQMKWSSLFRKFFSRVKTALERQAKQGSWQQVEILTWKEHDHGLNTHSMAYQRAEDLYSFTKWLGCYLFFSCYPSAPYERKTMAMALILIMVDVWPTISNPERNDHIYPYADGFVSPDTALLLVSSIVDSWDRLRESSYHILLSFPTPLPGISSCGSVKEVIVWAKNLVCSARVRESDAGALTMRLIFRKYILDLGWIISASTDVFCFDPHYDLLNGVSHNVKYSTPMLEYFLSLIDWLSIVVEEGEKDLSLACRNSSIHGVLLTLRYTFEELDWKSTVVLSNISGIKLVLEMLLKLIMRITSLALWVVSDDAWYVPDDTTDVIDDVDLISEVTSEVGASDSYLEMLDGKTKPRDDVGPTNQIVMVGCWLAMKEVSLLLGTIVRKVPLPKYASTDPPDLDNSFSSTGDGCKPISEDVILDFDQLERIGNHFLQVLLKMKHNGAIDKTRAGFTALCNRLLSSNDQRLCKMTEGWMGQLMERTIAKGQTVDDLLRRSAGIPASFIAFFLSEPEGTPKKLLPRALRWLIDVVNKSMLNKNEACSENVVPQKDLVKDPHQEGGHSIVVVPDHYGKKSKARDEGLVPTVHAFNVLRAAFNDTNLAADTSGFCAEALIISIRSFSSTHWEVRNGACLAYTALVRRMIGFLNIHKRESARRSLTGLEFFHRYPALHSFLLDELKIATESLADGRDLRSNMSKAIHPSLCPILILLSRLKPSLVSGGSNDVFDPIQFLPFIRRCAAQCNLRIRVLASRALTGLVSNERLPNILTEVVSALPCERSQMTMSTSVQSMYYPLKEKIDDESARPCASSFNSVHGVLLLLKMLVDSNCRNLIVISKKEKILTELIYVLIKCSWLGSITTCPCPTINNSFLQVLDCMLDISRIDKISRCGSLVQSLLKRLSSEYLDRIDSHALVYDPTELELRRQAVTSYFSCLFEVKMEDQANIHQSICTSPSLLEICKMHENFSLDLFQEKIMLCLSNSSYEVRFAVLKWLLRFLKSVKCKTGNCIGVIYTWAKINLQCTLLKLLAVEQNWKCVYYILRVIFFWNIFHLEEPANLKHHETIFFGTVDIETTFSFWNRLLSLNDVAMHGKTRESLICCLGICIRCFTQHQRDSSFIGQSQEGHPADDSVITSQYERGVEVYRSISNFIVLVKQHGASSEPVSMRKAVAESIIASGLLSEAKFISSLVSNYEIPCESDATDLDDKKVIYINPVTARNLYARRILDLWAISIQLLEDEDLELRQKLAKDILPCMSSEKPEQTYVTYNVPMQVEQVIESCFSFLSSIFKHWIDYFDFLSKWALNTASYVIIHGDLVRQVFDKEIDNHHEEKLLICQLCCHHLERIVKHAHRSLYCHLDNISMDDIIVYIKRWRGKFLLQVLRFAKEFAGAKGKEAWIGGLGNHKDAFTSIYANLLGLYALLQHPIEGIELPDGLSNTYKVLPDVWEITETLNPFLRNSLISSLYSLVMKSFEKTVRPIENHRDIEANGVCSLWEDFNPYYLLR